MSIKNSRKLIYLTGFLLSIPIALTSYINSSFLETYVGTYYIGSIYIISSIITIWGLLKMPKILTHLGNRLTFLIFGLLVLLSFIFLAFGQGIYIIISAFVFYFVFSNLVFVCLDIFIEDFSKNSNVGSLRGFYLMTGNLAWVISQLFSGPIINKSSYAGVYSAGISFIILTLIIFVFFFRDFKDPKYTKESITKTIKSFSKKKDLLQIYSINLILKFFYAWMIIYTPIYLHQNMHFSWDKISIIFFFMLLPFVLIEFPMGKLSDKIGEKKMLLFGFWIIILSTLSIPFIKEPNLLLWIIVLFFTRIGAASIEVMSESYFFKAVSEKNADEIDFFRNTTPLSYIIAPLLAIPILLLTPSFLYLFFILAVILFIGLLISFHIKDIK